MTRHRRGDAADRARWPRRRRGLVRARTDPAVWDPERPTEDLPSLGGTVYLTGLGLLGLAGIAWLSVPVAGVVYTALLVWSVAIEVTGNRLTTRVRPGPHRVAWALLRPAFAVGTVLHGVVELVVGLVVG